MFERWRLLRPWDSRTAMRLLIGFRPPASRCGCSRLDFRASMWLLVGLVVAGSFSRVFADAVQLGPRPFYLIDRMQDSSLKRQLRACAREITDYRRSDFSIGHRGAPLQFPEHTRESYEAAARMGAGMVECDLTFTRDKALVCRHAQCDLHTTTNILATPLAEKCSIPFAPAKFDPKTGERIKAAEARCCASDITLAEFKTLAGKMDSSNADARTVGEYLGGTPEFRTDLYATGGTLMSHAESIDLFRALGVRMIPELKSPEVAMPFDGFTREALARRMIDDYVRAGVPPADVFPQSFDLNDLLYWIEHRPEFGHQAIWLDGRDPREMHTNPPAREEFAALRAHGVTTIAPPLVVLLGFDGEGRHSEPSGPALRDKDLGIEPSDYARRARAAGLRIFSWTVERSGRIAEDVLPRRGAFYYGSIVDALADDGDVFHVIHALRERVGVSGLFSDWPATTTFYANCIDTEHSREGLNNSIEQH